MGGEKATVRIDRFAPGVRSRDLMLALSDRMNSRPPSSDPAYLRADYPIQDAGSVGIDQVEEIVCVAHFDATIDDLVRFVETTPGIGIVRQFQIPGSLPALLRHWVDAAGHEPLAESLDQLSSAISVLDDGWH